MFSLVISRIPWLNGGAYLRRWIHEIELEQILHSQRLEQQYCVCQVCSLNLRNVVREQLVQVGHFSIETIAESDYELCLLTPETHPGPVRPARPALWPQLA